MAIKATLAASVQKKNGRLHAVIQVKEDGKTKSVWRALGLPEGASQTLVNKAFRKVVTAYEEEYNKRLARDGRPDAEIPIFPFLCTYLEKAKPRLQLSTYKGYHQMVYSRVQEYFNAHPKLTVESITPKDIEAFYKWLFGKGLKTGSVIHYHTLLHSAFQQAYKDELLDVNPFERVERPKKSDFHGAHYSEDELVALFELCRSDPIWPCVVLAGGMGLRRSEVLGVRWSRIDMDKRTVLLDTKIVEEKTDGEPVLRAIEEMKNKSSRRTLPIPDPVYEMLETIRARQEINRKLFRGSYNRTWDDYVCTDELGNLMRPNFVTDHFSYLLKKLGLRHIRFHDLRHTFAVNSLKAGDDIKTVQENLVHHTAAFTLDVYAHVTSGMKQESANRMEKYLQSVTD